MNWIRQYAIVARRGWRNPDSGRRKRPLPTSAPLPPLRNGGNFFIDNGWNPRRAAVAGFVATVAYSIAMEGDMSLTGSRFSDVRFIEGLLPGGDKSGWDTSGRDHEHLQPGPVMKCHSERSEESAGGPTEILRFAQNDIAEFGRYISKSRPYTWLLAWMIHLLNGVMLGELYAAVFKRFLPGPNWLKGAIFGELFIVSAWWLTPLADKHHPMIKSGELPRLANWTAFFQNIARHLVFGLTLGLLYREKREA